VSCVKSQLASRPFRLLSFVSVSDSRSWDLRRDLRHGTHEDLRRVVGPSRCWRLHGQRVEGANVRPPTSGGHQVPAKALVGLGVHRCRTVRGVHQEVSEQR